MSEPILILYIECIRIIFRYILRSRYAEGWKVMVVSRGEVFAGLFAVADDSFSKLQHRISGSDQKFVAYTGDALRDSPCRIAEVSLSSCRGGSGRAQNASDLRRRRGRTRRSGDEKAGYTALGRST